MSKIPVIGPVINKWKNMSPTVKASTAYTVCSVLQKSISFFTMPFFYRLLTTEEYGDVTMYSSWMGMITVFITLNLAAGSFSTAMVKFEKDRDGYISSVQGINLYLLALMVIIYIPFRKTFNAFFELPTPIVLLMFAEISANNAWDLWAGKNRFEYKWKPVVAASVINALISPCLAMIIVLNTEQRGFARIVGFSSMTVIFGSFLFIRSTIRGKKLFNKEYWTYALSFNIPLIAYYLSQTIFNMSDRIMIDHLIGKSQAAIYNTAYTAAMILSFVLSAINGSYVPWFYGQLKEKKNKDNRSVSVAIALLLSLLLCGVIWFTPEFILLYAGADYAGAIYVVIPLALSMLLLFYAQLFINVEFFFERKKDLVWASIGSAIVNIVLNYFLIPIYGITAAGYTTLVSYVLFVLCNYFAMRRVLKQENREDNMYDYKLLILIFVLLCVLSAIGALLYPFLWVRIAVAVIVLALIIIKRKYFIDMYRRLRS